ncbi:MAG: signal peptidase I [Clostridia bacterium]|nr:signal peptidase I [Clostridia bacterium]
MENEKKLSSEETEKNTDPINDMDTLDALLFEGESGDDADYYEAEVQFDAFIAEYRDLISKTLSDAASEREQREAAGADGQEEYLTSLPKSKAQRAAETAESKNVTTESDWNDQITLTPEEYVDPAEEEAVMIDKTEVEGEPDNELGSITDDGNQFQISINFDGDQASTPEEDEKTSPKYDPENPRLIDWIFDIAEIFIFVLAAVMILSMFVFRPSMVEGGSMLNTLEDRDQLIISNLFYTPKRNDIIVFEDYSTSLKKAVVKRIIGLPGETVEVRVTDDGRRLIILIDGQEIEDEYGYYAYNGSLDGCAPITLGENEIFVMGDNRRNSTDSRYAGVGAVSTDAILGKVIFRFFPFDKIGTVD